MSRVLKAFATIGAGAVIGSGAAGVYGYVTAPTLGEQAYGQMVKEFTAAQADLEQKRQERNRQIREYPLQIRDILRDQMDFMPERIRTLNGTFLPSPEYCAQAFNSYIVLRTMEKEANEFDAEVSEGAKPGPELRSEAERKAGERLMNAYSETINARCGLP